MADRAINHLHSPEIQAKAKKARAAARLRPKKRVVISPDRQAAINNRRNEMPKACRNTYLKAVKGKSMRAALTAFCFECVMYQRVEIQLCTDLGCPLWVYRPFQQNTSEDGLNVHE